MVKLILLEIPSIQNTLVLVFLLLASRIRFVLLLFLIHSSHHIRPELNVLR